MPVRDSKKNEGLRYLILLSGIILSLLITYLYNYRLQGTDLAGCRSVSMYPSYARVYGFDQTHTKFASKYSLYLYREQGKDPIPSDKNEGFNKLDGIPVLFIPGNAGSYRQIRSIAAKTANLYFKNEYKGDNQDYKNFDFFAADYNEDFTAFHGKTMLDQAEYANEAIKFILNLYADNEYPPKSVIIIGHSMGGVVSRVMMTLENYVPESINTIITLSSPHAVSPLTFDRDILKIYKSINEFWQQAYFHPKDSEFSKIAFERLKDVSLISVTGGLLDTVLPADYTNLKGIIPTTNGFTVYTSGIPQVWTSIDHLAVVWCDQLRSLILTTLFDIVNFESPFKVKSLSERMTIFRKNFLSGFSGEMNLYDAREIMINLDKQLAKIDQRQIHITENTEAFNIFKVDKPNVKFLLLTDTKFEPFPNSYSPGSDTSLLLCNSSDDLNNDEIIEVSHDKERISEYLSLKCIDITSQMNILPRSYNTSQSLKESSNGDKHDPFYGITLDYDVLKHYKNIVITNFYPRGDKFVIGELAENNNIVVDKSGWQLLLTGEEIIVPKSITTNIVFPNIANSLVGLSVSFDKIDSGRSFQPFIRQWISSPDENKWHINLKNNESIFIHSHNRDPFINDRDELNLEVWNDNQNEEIIMTIHINLFKSFKLLFMRYRLSIVSYGIIITALVLLSQLYEIKCGKKKIANYSESMLKLITVKNSAIFIIFHSILNQLVKLSLVNKFINMINLESEQMLILGIENYQIINIILMILSITINFGLSQFITIAIKFLKSFNSFKENSSGFTKKLIINGILVLLTLTYLPYQVTYVICCLVQAMKLIKISDVNVFNYNFSILMMMIWILPINVPIIIVLIHNLALNWKTSFSSHHNILSILPILIRTNLDGSYPIKNWLSYLQYFMVIYIINYSFFYGSINTFWIYHLFNYYCVVEILMIYDNKVLTA